MSERTGRSSTGDIPGKRAHSPTDEDLRIAVEIILREDIPDLPTPKYEKAVKAPSNGHERNATSSPQRGHG